MSDTPRTDAFLISSDGYVDLPEADHVVRFCRGMEREINDLRAKLAAAEKDAWLDGFIDGAACFAEDSKPFKYSDEWWEKSITKKAQITDSMKEQA